MLTAESSYFSYYNKISEFEYHPGEVCYASFFCICYSGCLHFTLLNAYLIFIVWGLLILILFFKI